MTFFDLHWNKWEALDTSAFNSNKPSSHSCSKHAHLSYWCGFNTGCSWEMTCYRLDHDSINNPFPVSDVCDTFIRGMIRLARVRASPFHTHLSKFQQIKTLKSTDQVGETLSFPAHHLMLFTHYYTMTCPDRWAQIDITSFIMLCKGLRRQLNVLLHLVWENMLRCIPVWQTGDISSTVR